MVKIEEIWLPIAISNGMYEVSNLGEIRNSQTGKILKQNPMEKGYLIISLMINGKKKTAKVHRLVAEAFLPKSDDTLEINHLDKDKTNNKVSNLEWCTREENIKHGICKTIAKLDKSDNILSIYNSITEAAEQTNTHRKSICNCLHGKSKSAGGFRWKYLD